jgi:hypothetical protein
MPTADFSNQAYVEDDRKDRMVLSDFAGADFGDGADFGYGCLSYGCSETFEYGEARSEPLLKAIKQYHTELHAQEHPMSGGFEGQLGFDFLSSIKKTIASAGQKALTSTVTGVKQAAVQQVQSTVSSVTKTPEAQKVAQVVETIKKDPVVAQALQDPAKAPAVMDAVKQQAQAVVNTVVANKVPSAVIGLGLLGAAYFLFFRRR